MDLSLTLLAIACSGVIVAGIGNGAKRGVLIKDGEVIEKLGTVNTIAFDKTDTLKKVNLRLLI